MPVSNVERGERFIRGRSIAAIILATALIVTQGQRMDDGGSPLNWAIWGGIVLLFLVWASGLLTALPLRRIVSDETTRLHRTRSIAIGFWVMVASAMTCFALTFVKDYSPRDAIQVILTSGFAASLLGFGVLERSASAEK